MRPIKGPRVIFFAGKGGVGKTSVAAATGIRAAELGYRTIVISLDMAHSLSDVLDLDRGLFDQNRGLPHEVFPNLWIQELDILEEIEKNWKEVHRYFSLLLNTSGLDEILAEELAILPGMEEVSLLLHINRYVRNGEFDAILLDCAPTGESMRFISIPTALEWYMRKVFRMERTIARCVRPVMSRLYDVPLPQDDYFNALESLFARLQGVSDIISDPTTTSVRLVTNLEKVILKETQRAYTYLCLHRIHVDGIIVNRILPDKIQDPYFRERRLSQLTYAELARSCFDDVRLFSVFLQEDEVLGADRLRALARQIYNGADPLERFSDSNGFNLSKSNGRYILRLKMPFVEKTDLNIIKTGEELIIRIAGMKKIILLPRQLAGQRSVKAEMEDSVLKITFGGKRLGES